MALVYKILPMSTSHFMTLERSVVDPLASLRWIDVPSRRRRLAPTRRRIIDQFKFALSRACCSRDRQAAGQRAIFSVTAAHGVLREPMWYNNSMVSKNTAHICDSSERGFQLSEVEHLHHGDMDLLEQK